MNEPVKIDLTILNVTKIVMTNGINTLIKCIEYAPHDEDHLLDIAIIETNNHYLNGN